MVLWCSRPGATNYWRWAVGILWCAGLCWYSTKQTYHCAMPVSLISPLYLLQGELMVATNLFAVYGKPATMSRITLAFMQDTGWYDVDMEAAGFLNWGNKAGCTFVEKTCNDFIAQNPGQQYFCTREQYADTVNTMCTFDGLARARCEDAQFADGCGMKVRVRLGAVVAQHRQWPFVVG